jgi:hypothetical protein
MNNNKMLQSVAHLKENTNIPLEKPVRECCREKKLPFTARITQHKNSVDRNVKKDGGIYTNHDAISRFIANTKFPVN